MYCETCKRETNEACKQKCSFYNNGYMQVAEKVREYWRKEGITDVVVVLKQDVSIYTTIAFCQSDSDPNTVEFLDDFYEGQKNIKVFSITPLWEVLNNHEEEMIRLYDQEHEEEVDP